MAHARQNSRTSSRTFSICLVCNEAKVLSVPCRPMQAAPAKAPARGKAGPRAPRSAAELMQAVHGKSSKAGLLHSPLLAAREAEARQAAAARNEAEARQAAAVRKEAEQESARVAAAARKKAVEFEAARHAANAQVGIP